MAQVTTRELAAVRDHATTAAAYRETKLTVTLQDSLVELEVPDLVDRYGLANVIIQEPLLREVLQDLDEVVEVLSGASRVNENVTINIYGPYGPSPLSETQVCANVSANKE